MVVQDRSKMSNEDIGCSGCAAWLNKALMK